MSNSGKKTPLQLNAESELTVNKGLRISPIAIGYQGTWNSATPYVAPTGSTYSQGSVTNTNVLERLTSALPNFYNNAANNPNLSFIGISMPVWRNLIKIGRPIDSRQNNNRINCPALGNSRPETFKPSYAGYGTFKVGKITDRFYNMTTGTLGLVESIYPPYNYPTEGTYSYVYKNWSSLVAGPGRPTDDTQTTFIPFQFQYQYFNEYAWLTGWPGVNSWQRKTSADPQQAQDPVGDEDSYGAAYFPRPDLASTLPWRTRDLNKIEYDEYFRFGFIATVARQAYYEFWSEFNSRRSNQYIEFCKSFEQHAQFQEQTNKKISSFENTKTFVKGNYSNINDITTSDLAGVSLSFKIFGNDMIKLGKSLDLNQIHLFGVPSKFLLNLQKYNALTEALKFSLMYSDLTSEDLSDILLPTYTPSLEQEKKIYNGLKLIQGQDLNDICVIVNCTTEGLSSLADLINPIKMFPNSYPTLTVPKYNTETLSSKNYDFIYSGNNVNPRIENWGDYLEGILPEDLAKACGAFMCTMNQVKNIRQMEVEKLSQVVANLEVTNKGLPTVNSPYGVPGDVGLANQEMKLIALGSGSAGSYRFCDFMGAMSAWPYRDFFEPVQNLIKQLQTTELQNVYYKLYQKSLFNKWALISRGKGYPDSQINTTGINPKYAYDLFKATGSYGPGETNVGINAQTISLPINTLNLYNSSGRSARVPNGTGGYSSGDVWGQNPDSYSTGQLVSFTAGTSDSPSLQNTYVVLSTGSNTVTFQSIIDPIPNPNYQPNPSLPNYDPNQYLAPPVPGWPGLSISVSPQHNALIWEKEYNGYPGNGLLNGTVQNLTDAANLEILRIQGKNAQAVENLNYYWDKIGNQLFLEQRAIPFSVVKNDSIYMGSGRADLDSFVRSIEEYAQKTEYCETAPILEAISNIDNIGGQSIVAAMREARNARRLGNTGGEVDNDVPDNLNIQAATANSTVSNGSLASIELTSPGSGYSLENPPNVTIYPQGGVFGPGTGTGATAQVVLDNLGSIKEIIVSNSGGGYTGTTDPLNPSNPTVVIDAPPGPGPDRLGNSTVPGSFAGSPYTDQDPVPDNLVAPDDSSYTVPEAINDVTLCNCDCWNE